MSEALGFREFGGPQVQEFFDRPDPVPEPEEVLIRVTAAGVNPLDYILRAGHVRPSTAGGPSRTCWERKPPASCWQRERR